MSEMPPLVRQRQTCIECGMPAIARRLCRKHYDKAYSSIVRPKPARTLVDRGEIDRLTAENKALKAMLKRLEWQGWAGAEGEYCTECGKDPDEGHVTGCRMAALLGEI